MTRHRIETDIPSRREFDDRDSGGILDFRLFTLDLSTANSNLLLPLNGVFVYLDNLHTGVVSIKFNTAQNPAMPFSTNMALSGQPFKELYLTNTAQPGKTLRLWYGFDVSIIPPNQDIANIGAITAPVLTEYANITKRDELSFVRTTSNNASASNYSIVQLWNPAGSGVNLFVYKFFVYSPTAQVYLMQNTAAIGSPVTGSTINKKLGGAPATAVLNFAYQATVPGLFIMEFQRLSNGMMEVPFKEDEPIWIPPGYGLHLVPAAVNSNIYAGFEWREEGV